MIQIPFELIVLWDDFQGEEVLPLTKSSSVVLNMLIGTNQFMGMVCIVGHRYHMYMLVGNVNNPGHQVALLKAVAAVGRDFRNIARAPSLDTGRSLNEPRYLTYARKIHEFLLGDMVCVDVEVRHDCAGETSGGGKRRGSPQTRDF